MIDATYIIVDDWTPSPQWRAYIESVRDRFGGVVDEIDAWNEPVGEGWIDDAPTLMRPTYVVYDPGLMSRLSRSIWFALCARPKPGSLLARRIQAGQRRRAAKRRRSAR